MCLTPAGLRRIRFPSDTPMIVDNTFLGLCFPSGYSSFTGRAVKSQHFFPWLRGWNCVHPPWRRASQELAISRFGESACNKPGVPSNGLEVLRECSNNRLDQFPRIFLLSSHVSAESWKRSWRKTSWWHSCRPTSARVHRMFLTEQTLQKLGGENTLRLKLSKCSSCRSSRNVTQASETSGSESKMVPLTQHNSLGTL